MKIKPIRRTQTIYSTILYLIFSYLLFFILLQMSTGSKILSLLELKSFMENYQGISAFFLINLFMVFKAKRQAIYFCAAFYFFVWIKILNLYFVGFEKEFLVGQLFFFILSYTSILSLRTEFNGPLYQAKVAANSVDLRHIPEISVKIRNEKGEETDGFITSLSGDSHFVFLDPKKIEFKGKLQLSLDFEGNSFEWSGLTYSIGQQGIGCKIINTSDDKIKFDWKDFYYMISKRGFFQA